MLARIIYRELCLTLLAVAALLGATAAIGQSANHQTDVETRSISDRVDAVFGAYNNRTPGCSVAVIRNGETILERGYGMANLEYGIALDGDSVLRIGSTSKQFTTASVVLLALDGKMSLDDEIHEFFPELQDYGAPITVRHLIHHTSGLRDYLVLMTLAGKRDLDYYTDQEVVDMLALQTETNFAPGSEFLYSNSGYFLLGQIVLRVTGKTLAEFAAERIFTPLGMKHTHFHDDSTRIVRRRASGYAPKEGSPGEFQISMTTLPMIGDGGVFTTVEDLALWDRNFYTGEVGGQPFLDELHRRGLLSKADGASEEIPYAGGLSHGQHRGLRTVAHGGAFVGFRAELVRFPEQRLSVVCLCNRADANPSRLARQVAEVYLEDQMGPPEEEEGREDDDSSQAKPEISRAAPADKWFAGVYRADQLDTSYRISYDQEKGELKLEVGNELDSVLERVADYRFEGADGFVKLQFEPSGEANAQSFSVEAGRVRNLRFERQPTDR
jgi:CubicO group peptidase (beta-lactamase class C family)